LATPLDSLLTDAPSAPAPQRKKPESQSEDNLGMLVSWFDDAEEATETARKATERDRDYYDGKQYTSAELKILRDRGQPDIVINRIKPKVDFLMGYEATNRTDPRAFPRTPQDQDASEAATDALRYVKDATDLDQIFSNVWENLLIEGMGGLELTVEQQDDGTVEIVPVRWDWDRLFYDPHARRHDFSDARYLGGVLWMDAEEARRKWPDAADAIDVTLSESSFSRTYDDRPDRWVSRGSADGTRKRVRIVQMYYKEGGRWHHCTFTKGGKLEALEVPFIDQKGMGWCPLLMQSAYVDRENARYGLVRIMIGVQDEINKRRSKALHRLTMRQAIMEHGSVEDEDGVKKELAKPDGLVKVNPGFRFELLEAGDKFTAELQLLQEAKNEIELMGPNAAMLGKDEKAPSGRAILANQQSGQTEIALLMDRHRHIKKRTYQRIWDLIRQYKKEEWWVRVTDDEKNVKFVGINRPVTAKEELSKRIQSSGGPEEEVAAQIQQLEMLAQQDPALNQVVRTENNPTEMHMDITIEEVPDVASVQEEQFQQLTALAPAVVFPPQVYIEASSLRNKKRLLEVMNGQQDVDPVAAEMQKIMGEQALKKTQAEIDKLNAEVMKITVEADMADAQIGMIQMPTVNQPGAMPTGEQPQDAASGPQVGEQISGDGTPGIPDDRMVLS
jgi:hypothetical protein